MHIRILAFLMLLGVATAAPAQINIGINFSLFPELVRVPDYPVYYAPRQNANYFFYDGMYWVYRNDDWYSSDWYNGPWWRTAPEYVPEYVLRVPVRYYRQPPPYFRGWQRNAPPRWGEHWGRDWEQRRSGWDKWDRRAAPRPAPLPTYQRQYSGKKYPHVEEQHKLHDQKYRYEPKDNLVREHVRPQMQGASTRDRQPEPRKDSARDEREQRSKDSRERDQRSQDSAKDARDREQRNNEARKDGRERDQRPAPSSRPEQKSEQPAQRQQPEPRKDAGREGRDQRPPREAAPPAAEPNKGRDRQGADRQDRDKGQEREREKRDERGK